MEEKPNNHAARNCKTAGEYFRIEWSTMLIQPLLVPKHIHTQTR